MIASSTESEIWSAILSGCPSVTDSDVNRYSSRAIRPALRGAPLDRPRVRDTITPGGRLSRGIPGFGRSRGGFADRHAQRRLPGLPGLKLERPREEQRGSLVDALEARLRQRYRLHRRPRDVGRLRPPERQLAAEPLVHHGQAVHGGDAAAA